MTTNGASDDALSLNTIRNVLIRLEDTIIFSLIERAKFPINSKAYDDCPAQSTAQIHGLHCSFAELFIRESEAVQATFGRYKNPEETPFFTNPLPPSPCLPSYSFPKVLYPAAASINVSSQIWDFYFKQLLPLFTSEGDDGNYASTVACDLTCLQALARRIHYGKFVAEAKYRGAPNDYGPPIRSKDQDTLMKLLTDESVEEMVKQRVAKKATVFGQDVTLNDTGSSDFKVDPSVVSHLYNEWVIPLTKVVEVEYLLRRLD
ncbi:hypothetical protein V2J09_003359 [Rumex salicifolius]